jgi:hypothetical protein
MIDILEFMGKPGNERHEILDKMSVEELEEFITLQTQLIVGLMSEKPMIVRDPE